MTITKLRAVDPDGPDTELVARFKRDLFRAKGGLLVAMLIREGRAEDQAAQQKRFVRTMAGVAPGPDGEDHGMDLGPAALARTRTLERIDGKLRGAGQRQADPVYAVRVEASTLFERLRASGQLSDRQADAGAKLMILRRMGSMDRRITARYPVTPVTNDDDDEVELASIVPDGYDARTWHRWLMRRLPAHTAALIDAACGWTPENRTGHPGVRFLATMQAGLDRVADLMNLPRE